ncbi:MAG: MBL fold metallo-hydrolase [bacterium]
MHPRLTYIGGATALLELDGLRLLTDPTFDPAGTEYPAASYVLRKSESPALSAQEVGAVDAVLLSHDHHADNLDRTGREVLGRADRVITTDVGAERLGGNAVGLRPWQSVELATKTGRTLRITATPARHGPPEGDRGPVIGFALAFTDAAREAVYVSGDTVWYEGVASVASAFDVEVAILFGGAARVAAVGPAPLTFTAPEMVTAAQRFASAVIVPLHYEGWEHFSESRAEIEREFESAALGARLRWPKRGQAITL